MDKTKAMGEDKSFIQQQGILHYQLDANGSVRTQEDGIEENGLTLLLETPFLQMSHTSHVFPVQYEVKGFIINYLDSKMTDIVHLVRSLSSGRVIDMSIDYDGGDDRYYPSEMRFNISFVACNLNEYFKEDK